MVQLEQIMEFTDDHHVINHGDHEKDKFFTPINIVSLTFNNQDLVTRDFLMGVTNNVVINNNNAIVPPVMVASHISTELELYCDPWKIKKKLTRSDLNDLSRLLIPSRSVRKHVLPFMRVDAVQQVETYEGLRVHVLDLDTHSLHQLVFKKWLSSQAYHLSLKWRKDFVKRRDLKEGDQIGLFWDHHHSRFRFRVLQRINN